MLQYIIANSTDKGMVRPVNEDSMVTFDSPNGRVVAVCDGMGGQAAGDVASQLACDIIRDILENNTFATPTEAITRAIMAANQAILHRTSTTPELEGMGSTCVIVIIKDGLVYYGWVGDSRIYYYSNGVLRQISKDQSYVQQLVDSGQISAQEAETHPQKNEITNALGVEGMTPPQLCPAPLTPEPGSVMLLCSDGLSGMVGLNQMQQILSENVPLQNKANTLVAAANAAGGLDNITVQLVEFNAPAAAAPGVAPAREAAMAAVKSSNRMMTYILIVVVLILLALGFWFFMNNKSKSKGSAAVEQEMVDGINDERTKTVEDIAPAPTTTTTTVKTTVTETKKAEPAPKKAQPAPKKAQPAPKKPTNSNTTPPITDKKGNPGGNKNLKDKLQQKETPKEQKKDPKPVQEPKTPTDPGSVFSHGNEK